jgi:hypothetical protein
VVSSAGRKRDFERSDAELVAISLDEVRDVVIVVVEGRACNIKQRVPTWPNCKASLYLSGLGCARG